MNDRQTTPRQTLTALKGNLWDWRGVNPYDGHPLEILELDREPQIAAPLLNAKVQQIAQREQHGKRGGMLSGRARELLMNPVTRVFCELLRIPPVAVPKDEIERIRRAAEERFKTPPELPPLDDLAVRPASVVDRIVEAIVAEDPPLDSMRGVAIDATPAPDIERQRFAGMVFRQRTQREV